MDNRGQLDGKRIATFGLIFVVFGIIAALTAGYFTIEAVAAQVSGQWLHVAGGQFHLPSVLTGLFIGWIVFD